MELSTESTLRPWVTVLLIGIALTWGVMLLITLSLMSNQFESVPTFKGWVLLVPVFGACFYAAWELGRAFEQNQTD